MPSPSSALSTQRPDLAASLEEFDLMMDAAGFIGHRVFPVVDVASQAGSFGKIPIEQLLQNRDTARAPGSGYNRGQWKFETATFSTSEQGVEEPIDDREAAMYANYFDAEVIATQRAMRAVIEAQEKRIAAKVFNATTYTATTITNEWDDYVNAVPITDVEAKIQAMYAASGLWPNAMIINQKVFRNLRNCAQIVDRVKYQGFQDARPGNISVQAIAQVLAIDNLLVAGGTKATSNEGATLALAPIWSNEYAWIGRIATSNDFKEPCVGRIFHWNGDGSVEGGRVETYRDESIRADVVRVRHDVAEVDLHTTCNGIFDNVTT